MPFSRKESSSGRNVRISLRVGGKRPFLKTAGFGDLARDGPQVRGADGWVEGRTAAGQDVEVGLLPSGELQVTSLRKPPPDTPDQNPGV